MAHSNELECADADELFSMEVEDLFDDSQDAWKFKQC